MKYLPLILISIFCLSCTETRRPIRLCQDYPDYPPLVVANGLESEFDTARLLFYTRFSCFKCASLDKGRFRTEDFYGKISYIPPGNDLSYEVDSNDLAIIRQTNLFHFSIGLDTLVIKQDTVVFAIKPMVNDTLFCRAFIAPSRNNMSAGFYYTIAVSRSADTILYVRDGWGVTTSYVWNYPSYYNREKKELRDSLEAYLSKPHDLPITPWLQKHLNDLP